MFGLKGELKCDPTAAGAPLFVPGANFSVLPGQRSVNLASVRAQKGRLLLSLQEAPNVASAAGYVGVSLFAPRSRVIAELEPDEILDEELLGIRALDTHGQPLGEIVAVEHYPSSAMLVIGPQRVLVPFVKAYIREFDRSARRIILDLPAGLF